MNPIEKDLMTGMISILNQAIESKHCGTPIITDDCFNVRLADLKIFEDETDVMFVNSPNCKLDLKSIINIKEISKDNLKECKDISDIIDYFKQNKTLIYPDIVGSDMVATYTNGYLTNIQTNDIDIENKIKYINLPYKIKKDGTYTVKGTISITDKPIFYVNGILEGGSWNLGDDLSEAKELNFDVTSFWCANNLNSNKLKEFIDYIIDCMVEDNLNCNGVIFKLVEKKFSNALNFVGCSYNNKYI